MPDIISFIQTDGLLLIFKLLLLVLIFVYIIFSFIVFSRIRALNRTIYLVAAHASATMVTITLISFFLAVSLFIATLVIL